MYFRLIEHIRCQWCCVEQICRTQIWQLATCWRQKLREKPIIILCRKLTAKNNFCVPTFLRKKKSFPGSLWIQMSDIFLTYWFCHVTLMWKVKLWYTQPLIQMSVVCNFMTRRSRKSHLLPFLKLISRGSDGREEKVGQEKVERPSTASSKDFILCPPFSKKGKINFFIEFFFVLETSTIEWSAG